MLKIRSNESDSPPFFQKFIPRHGKRSQQTFQQTSPHVSATARVRCCCGDGGRSFLPGGWGAIDALGGFHWSANFMERSIYRVIFGDSRSDSTAPFAVHAFCKRKCGGDANYDCSLAIRRRCGRNPYRCCDKMAGRQIFRSLPAGLLFSVRHIRIRVINPKHQPRY